MSSWHVAPIKVQSTNSPVVQQERERLKRKAGLSPEGYPALGKGGGGKVIEERRSHRLHQRVTVSRFTSQTINQTGVLDEPTQRFRCLSDLGWLV